MKGLKQACPATRQAPKARHAIAGGLAPFPIPPYVIRRRPHEFLAIDIGSTRLKWALFDTVSPHAHTLAHGAVFLETIDHLRNPIGRCCRRRPGCWAAWWRGGGQAPGEEQMEIWDITPRWWCQENAHGVTNGYDHPNRLGPTAGWPDRGPRARLMRGRSPGPALVVMVGTAVTVDALDANGCFLGGLIPPGFGLMLRALESGTAGLKVPTGDVREFPTTPATP